MRDRHVLHRIASRSLGIGRRSVLLSEGEALRVDRNRVEPVRMAAERMKFATVIKDFLTHGLGPPLRRPAVSSVRPPLRTL